MAVVKACDVKVNASVQINNLCMNSRQLSNGVVGRQFQQLPPPPDQLLIFLTQIVF